MKFLKRFLIVILLLLLVVISGSWIAVHFYGNEIKSFVVNSINQQLKTKVDVAEVDISFWKNFPQTSVVFHKVIIYGVDSESERLLTAEDLSATFSLLDLYRGNYKLKGLKIENGSCQMRREADGTTNYIFWQENDSEKGANFSLDLEKVQLINMQYDFVDVPNAVEINFLIKEAMLSGKLSDEVFELELKTTLKHSNIKNADFTFVKDHTLFVYSKGKVDTKNSSLTFDDANLGIEGMNFKLNGKVDYGNKPAIHLEMESENTSLAKAIPLLPEKVRSYFATFDIEGKANINGSIDGPLSAIDQPAYRFNFFIEDGRFEEKSKKLLFEKSTLSGTINNGAAHSVESSELKLSNFKTIFNGGLIQGDLTLQNFKQPNYAFNGSVDFKLKDATALFSWDDLKLAEGDIKATIQVKGRLNKLDEYTLNDWKHSTVKGNIDLNQIGFYYNKGPQHIHQVNGQFSLNNNDVDIKSLSVMLNKNNLNISGSFNNLIGYLLEEKEMLLVDAKLKSQNIQLEDFLLAEESEDTTSFQLRISPQLKIYLKTKVDTLSFKDFQLTNLKGDFVVNNQQLDARNLAFNSQGGSVNGNLFIRENTKDLSSFVQVDIKDVDIKQLFKTFGNFGQNTLEYNHLKGKATASINYSCQWSKNLVPNLKSLKVESDLLIENGELNNFKPLEKLSKFISLDALQDVHFKTLSNQILIKDETVYIPKFEVNSSALNISIKGKHGFDNSIDYNFVLLLNELLGKQVRKPKENEFGYVEDDGLGRTQLFVRMNGTVDNPHFSYDKTALKEHLQSEVENEKKTVKKLLNEEFGLFKKDPSLKGKEKTKEKKKQLFEIEWEENEEAESKKNRKQEQNSDNYQEVESKKKGKWGKLLDKIAEPNKEEFVEPKEK